MVAETWYRLLSTVSLIRLHDIRFKYHYFRRFLVLSSLWSSPVPNKAVKFGGSLGRPEKTRMQFWLLPPFFKRMTKKIADITSILNKNCFWNLVEVFEREEITLDMVLLLSVSEMNQSDINNRSVIMNLLMECAMPGKRKPQKERLGSGAPEIDIPKSVLENHLEEGFMIKEISSIWLARRVQFIVECNTTDWVLYTSVTFPTKISIIILQNWPGNFPFVERECWSFFCKKEASRYKGCDSGTASTV